MRRGLRHTEKIIIRQLERWPVPKPETERLLLKYPHYTHNQKTGLNSARFQLFRFHTHLFDHIFLFCRPCAGHVSVLHEQFLLCIHVFCGVEFFYIGLMP